MHTPERYFKICSKNQCPWREEQGSETIAKNLTILFFYLSFIPVAQAPRSTVYEGAGQLVFEVSSID